MRGVSAQSSVFRSAPSIHGHSCRTRTPFRSCHISHRQTHTAVGAARAHRIHPRGPFRSSRATHARDLCRTGMHFRLLLSSRNSIKHHLEPHNSFCIVTAESNSTASYFASRCASRSKRSEAAQEKISRAPQYFLSHRGVWQHPSNFDCPDHRGKDRKESPLFVRGSPPRHERHHAALVVH